MAGFLGSDGALQENSSVEKTELLEDIIKGNSNPDVRQRGRSGQRLSTKFHGGGEQVRVGRKGRGESCRQNKLLRRKTLKCVVTKSTLTISSLGQKKFSRHWAKEVFIPV